MKTENTDKLRTRKQLQVVEGLERVKSEADALRQALAEQSKTEQDRNVLSVSIERALTNVDLEDAKGIAEIAEGRVRLELYPGVIAQRQLAVKKAVSELAAAMRVTCLSALDVCYEHLAELAERIENEHGSSLVGGKTGFREAGSALIKDHFMFDWARAFRHETAVSPIPSHALGSAETLMQWIPLFDAGQPRPGKKVLGTPIGRDGWVLLVRRMIAQS